MESLAFRRVYRELKRSSLFSWKQNLKMQSLFLFPTIVDGYGTFTIYISSQCEVQWYTNKIFARALVKHKKKNSLSASSFMVFLGGSEVKNPPAIQDTQKMWIQSLGQEDLLDLTTHCSILAWKIPWTEEPGGLWSMGSQRVGYDWVTEHGHTHALI